ncbi:phytyl ester synthase 1, chloroplastic-like [Euphorbia lathyris]|uniref:phytyl ester synthase 1, chloroplastic-like n=1 Tax=Euphorbia lathyris TaxID=212925 RepID=UPI00331409E0
MALIVPSVIFPCTLTYSEIKPQFHVRVQRLGGSDSVLSSNSVSVNGGASFTGQKEKNEILIGEGTEDKEENKVLIKGGNGRLKSRTEKNWEKDAVSKDLELFWDDGYGTKTVKDYLEEAREIIQPDGGPPRWFCPVECGQPLKNSPVLLYLPGLDGVGLGLTLHHKALGKVFAVQCLHIPVYDRTPLEGLVKFVEETVRLEHASSPKKPIYLVGDSLGGCLALAVAARNPNIDLVLILSNPATFFGRSLLQPLIPILEALPKGLHNAVPYILSCILGNPVEMAMADIEHRLSPRLQIEQLSANLIGFLPHLSALADIFPKDTVLWKLKLLNSAAAYANSHLHAVKAEVLVLASHKDNMVPSKDEAEYLQSSLQNCTVRSFKDNGHALLMEGRYSLLSIIKCTGKYRRSKRHDIVSDFVPPSMSEYKFCFDETLGLLRMAGSYAVFSTLDDGKIVRGLAGVPDEGPVLLVGNHMLMGLEVAAIVEAFLEEKNLMVHGLAHPMLFNGRLEPLNVTTEIDWVQLMGAVPVTGSNCFKLLSSKSHVLLCPGGGREAFHYKGEEYKIIWPEKPEFVRMAARFGATIVPFASVGEEDISHMALDYHDLLKIPVLNDFIRDFMSKAVRVRGEGKREVSDGELFIPGVIPKIPTGRVYSLFGKPIKTKGKEELLQQKGNANEMYMQVKSQVRSNMDYLLKKRKEDPYRDILDRTLYRALYSLLSDIPSFDP